MVKKKDKKKKRTVSKNTLKNKNSNIIRINLGRQQRFRQAPRYFRQGSGASAVATIVTNTMPERFPKPQTNATSTPNNTGLKPPDTGRINDVKIVPPPKKPKPTIIDIGDPMDVEPTKPKPTIVKDLPQSIKENKRKQNFEKEGLRELNDFLTEEYQASKLIDMKPNTTALIPVKTEPSRGLMRENLSNRPSNQLVSFQVENEKRRKTGTGFSMVDE